MWRKKEKKIEKKKEGREEGLLKELCGGDAKLHDLLSQSMYVDPIAAISKTDLKILVEEAENSIREEDYEKAMQEYRRAVNKAIFEATQSPGEMGRHIKVIQDLASKTAKVTEKVKEKREKEGSASPSLEGRIRYYELMSERVEDVVKIACLYYSERLEELGAIERREARRKERKDAENIEEREEKEAKQRREARTKEMGGGEKREAEREDKGEEKREKERGEARREEAREAEREEDRTAEREKERRAAGRKEK